MIDTITGILIYLFSSVIHLILFIKIRNIKHSRQLHRVCALNVLILLLWTVFRLSNFMVSSFTGRTIYIIYFLGSVCVFFLPATLIVLCILLVKEQITHKITYVLIFIPPVSSTLILATNDFHKLFIKIVTSNSASFVYGICYYIHCTWQLVYATFAVLYLLYFSLKYTNCLTKQILLVVSGIITPIAVDYLVYLSYFSTLPVSLPDSIYTLSYCFTAICLTLAIKKYKFLDTLPIAIRSIVDYISDSFLVIDYKSNILEMNNNFKAEFGPLINMDEGNLFKALSAPDFKELKEKISQYTSNLDRMHTNAKFEHEFIINGTSRYFEIEIIHIYVHEQFIALLILLRNMTEHRQVIRLMEENSKQMIEKARLISLHNLIGGISHNIKSPLMSSSGGILALKNHTRKIEGLLEELNKNDQYTDYVEIIEDMKKWEDSIKHYLVYISDIITAVKDQTTSMNGNQNRSFTVNEVLNKIKILLDFELKRSNCKLSNVLNKESDTQIEGDISALTQILGNVIINATQAYSDGGTINLEVCRDRDGIVFVVQDQGKGIAPEVKARIFNEMVTTKGKDGSGLGLYFANIAIKCQFKGSMRLESEEGKGTIVYISIPLQNKV
jgi:signal transduction histidine kinase